MKKTLLAFACLILSVTATRGQVKIGAAGTPDASAVLDLAGTTRGLLVPRLTLAQRNAIVTPATGLLIYQTDNTPSFYFYTGSAWTTISGSTADIILPYIRSQAAPATTLFSLTNTAATGFGGAIQGATASTESSTTAILGTVSSTAPGGFSSAIKGVNSGTGGLGIGVWGSQNGSGWAVYGVTPSGLGVYGNSSGSGYGIYANSNSGTGLSATSTNGPAANISINNNGNSSTVLTATTLGNGNVIDVTASGSGTGVRATTNDGFGVQGITTAQTSAGVMGDNNSGGEAVVGRTTSDIAGAVVGRNDGGGYGVRGFIATSTANTGAGVFGQVGINSSTGMAGRFDNSNASNTAANTLAVTSISNGNIGDNTLGNAASFTVNNTNSVSAAVRGEINSIFGNFGAAGIFGVSSGTGGRAGLFYASNPSGNGQALIALADGNGDAIVANAGKNGDGVGSSVDGSGNAIFGWVPSFGTGRAARFDNFNTANNTDVVTATTVGNGIAGSFKVDNTNGTSPGVKGEVNSIFSNFGTAGVYGLASGTGGFAGLFYASNLNGNAPGVLALTDGNGNGITSNAGKNGHGMEASCDGTGNAVYGWIPNFGVGKAARFANFNTGNANPVVHVTNAGTGNALLINHTGASGSLATFQSNTTNVARIDKSGRGYFNNGTQVGGADVAEYFDVEGSRNTYEPGDVLMISASSDRTVEKAIGAYTTLVAGVYATKPGVLLTERNATEDQLEALVPMGVIGVIPTKVCLEGGPIKRGDLLVTSSTAGVAMKADIDKVKPGQVIGKALQEFSATSVEKINVLVSIK